MQIVTATSTFYGDEARRIADPLGLTIDGNFCSFTGENICVEFQYRSVEGRSKLTITTQVFLYDKPEEEKKHEDT